MTARRRLVLAGRRRVPAGRIAPSGWRRPVTGLLGPGQAGSVAVAVSPRPVDAVTAAPAGMQDESGHHGSRDDSRDGVRGPMEAVGNALPVGTECVARDAQS